MLDFPNTPAVGDTLELDGIQWVWDGVKWAHPEGATSGTVPRISTGQFPPAPPSVGDLWFDPVEGQLYIWFDDGTSTQWVVTINQGEGGGGGAGGLSPDQPTINQPVIMGVTDGSSAGPGEVGEFLIAAPIAASGFGASGTTSVVQQLNLPAGDWDVSGNVNLAWVNGLMSTLTYAIAALNTVPNVIPFVAGGEGVDGSAMGVLGSTSQTILPTLAPGRKRFSSATASIAYLNVRAIWVGGDSMEPRATITARRMR